MDDKANARFYITTGVLLLFLMLIVDKQVPDSPANVVFLVFMYGIVSIFLAIGITYYGRSR